MPSEPEVSIIILNWNGRGFLEPCLMALQAQTFPASRFEIVLVENGSTDGSAAWLRTRFGDWLKEEAKPRLKLIELSENQGFAGGNLVGLEHCHPSSRYIATLNNDTEAQSGWLAALVAALEARPKQERWAAVGGAMLFAGEQDKASPRIASAGIEVRRDGLALDRRIGERLREVEREEEIFGVCAGAALYRREALDQVGFFDPAFFAYLEDADLAWRLRLAGWRSLYVPEALVWHEYSGTGKQGSPFKSFQLGRNRLWTIFKNWPAPMLVRYACAILFYDLAASIYTLLLRRDPHPLRGRLAALHPTHLRRILAQRRQIQRQRTIAVSELKKWLGRSASPLEMLALRRTADTKAAK
ncbi:MAG: glycosyltransferase family 2 protein [Chloroflexota bacterium]|nr:glycosyltransferase family 2 protein [Chloroflexota bacterium]